MPAIYGLERKYKTYFFIVTLNATLGSFCFGKLYLGYGMSQMNSIMLIDKDISPALFSILTLVLSAGGMLGAYLGFPLSDTRGRRFGFFIADLIAALGVILTCIGWEIRNEAIAVLIVARFLTGVSIGIFSYLVPLYCILYIVREIVPREISGHLISLHSVMIALGHFVAYVTTLPTIDPLSMYISFCVPLIAVVIQAFLLYFFYEFETPSFLWLKNKRSEVSYIQAMTVISRLYLITEASPRCSLTSEDEIQDYPIISLKDVMKDSSLRRSLINCITLGAFTNLVGINLFLVYFPAYARDTSNLTVQTQTFIIYLSYFILSLFIFLILNSNFTSEIGRVRLLKLGSIGMGLCYLILAFRPLYLNADLNFGIVMAFIFLYQNSIGSIYYIYSSDILIPKSFSISLTFYWAAFIILDVILSIFLFQVYRSHYLVTMVCGFYGVMCVLLYVFCRARLTASLMMTNEEVEDHLQNKLNYSTNIEDL